MQKEHIEMGVGLVFTNLKRIPLLLLFHCFHNNNIINRELWSRHIFLQDPCSHFNRDY